ncbi:uncharacterized protein LOC142143256 [Mixophyes fleayi]|uniref:uncharacterized protein LOC142143256 n=1 Tax=Mixophyes fleayi TaxID=3061075 RepID=UPI003F4D8D2D
MSDAGPSNVEAPGLPTRRKNNFIEEELEVLVEEVLARFHSGNRQITGRERQTHWQEITRLINEISPYERTKVEVQKRWADYKGRLKAKLVELHRHAQGTGGGPRLRTTLTPLEERARAAIALVEIVGVGDIDTGSSPPRTGEAAPLACEQQAPASPVDEEVARDVEEPQLPPAEYVRQRTLARAAENLKDVTLAQNVHLSHISSTVQHTDQQIDRLTNTLSDFMSTHTSLLTTLATKIDNLNTSVTNIATLLGDILHVHSQRTSGTIPSPSSDYLFASPHTQLSVASALPDVSVASALPDVSVASALPDVKGR